jgi:hypothetical protein
MLWCARVLRQRPRGDSFGPRAGGCLLSTGKANLRNRRSFHQLDRRGHFRPPDYDDQWRSRRCKARGRTEPEPAEVMTSAKLPDISSEHRVFNAVLAALLSIAILTPLTVTIPGVARSYGPISWHPPACRVRQRTGHDCASCGLTRSIATLYRGEWNVSRSYHPAGYLVVLFIFVELILRLVVTRIRLPWIAWGDLGQLVAVCVTLGAAILLRA